MSDVAENDFDRVAAGDCVKARIGNESLWFEVLSRVENNALVCRLSSVPVTPIIFDGRCTIDRFQVVDVHFKASPMVRDDFRLTVIDGGKP